MKLKEWSFVALISGFDGGKVLGANDALGSDGLFGPHDDLGAMLLQPNVREHPGPSTVSIQKRMNPDGSVVKSRRLFHKIVPKLFPRG